MAKKFFITATNTDIGKTYTTKKLLKEFASRGHRVGVIKPIESGVKDKPLDGSELYELAKELNSDFSKFDIEDVVPYQFELPAAPYIANIDSIMIDTELIKRKITLMEEVCDIIIIEGAGGLLVPIKKDYFIIDMIKDLNASTLLVTHGSLGCINDTLLSLQALKAKEIKHTFAINIKDKNSSFDEVSKKYIDDTFEDTLFVDKDIEKICNSLLGL